MPTFARWRRFLSRSGELRRRRVDFAFEFGLLRRDDGIFRANASATNVKRFLAFLGAGSNAFKFCESVEKTTFASRLKSAKYPIETVDAASFSAFLGGGELCAFPPLFFAFDFLCVPIFSEFLLESRQISLKRRRASGIIEGVADAPDGCAKALTGDSARD